MNPRRRTSPIVVAVVGLCGSGKSEVSDWFVGHGFSSIRFGQLTLDVVKRRGLAPTEKNERFIREQLRRQHGPAAFAKLNIPRINRLLARRLNVFLDGLYSWSEYKLLKKKYGQKLFVIAVYAPPEVRYARLENRHTRYGADPLMRYRSFSRTDAAARDRAEIEKIEKAGPIAMADYTIQNTGTLRQLARQIHSIYRRLPDTQLRRA